MPPEVNAVFTTIKPRIIQWAAGPIAIAAGIVATWLTTHVHLLATFHIDQSGITGTLTQLGIFAVGALVTYLPQHNWVRGHQIELQKAWEAYIAAGAFVPSTTGASRPTSSRRGAAK